MHGLLDSSDTFIINEETSALAFVLANRGYDVWLGNNRGNKHSKKHVSLDSKDDQFWDYTFEEMAIFDLPAGFKYIYEQTNQKIIYIGHSEGTA
jgi:pimeloyl-ACP methyl ester carboxylesterase